MSSFRGLISKGTILLHLISARLDLCPMSEYQIMAVIAGFAFVYGLVASRLERTPINGALVYVGFGILFGLVDLNIGSEGLMLLPELTLAIVLFSDLANANLPVLRKFERLPIRVRSLGIRKAHFC